MFKFGFQEDYGEKDNNATNKIEENIPSLRWYEAEEIFPDLELLDKLESSIKTANVFITGDDNTYFYLDSSSLVNNCSKTVKHAESTHSDLVKGEYEGGLKIWDCTQNLANFLTTSSVGNSEIPPAESFQNKTVLDLGCGAGILGIIALQNGAEFVCFQDYNRDVLEHFTIPNVKLNYEGNYNEVKNRAGYFSGDWESYNKLDAKKYDFILTSETIYNIDNYEKLIELFKTKLTQTGYVYLAAKTYYFGVGGGTRLFEKAIENDGVLKSTLVCENVNGVHWEILEINRLE